MSFPLFSKTYCGPSCVTSSSRPSVAFGNCGIGGGSSAVGYGGGYSYGASAASLGIIPGVTPSCISQIPSSEVTILPSPISVTIPGPILSASSEPVFVDGYSPCAYGGYGYGSGGYGLGGLGGLLGGGSCGSSGGIFGSKQRPC